MKIKQIIRYENKITHNSIFAVRRTESFWCPMAIDSRNELSMQYNFYNKATLSLTYISGETL